MTRWVLLPMALLLLGLPLLFAQAPVHPMGRCLYSGSGSPTPATDTPSACVTPQDGARYIGRNYPIWSTPDPADMEHVGAVEIGDECYPCGWNDSVCPQLFQDPNFPNPIGDCLGCPDPDCQGALEGDIEDPNGAPLSGAVVKVVSQTNTWLPTYTSAATGADGHYRLAGLPAGNLIASASRNGYDTAVKNVLVRNTETTAEDFELIEGTCHPDCTDAFNRCGDCEGINGCDYPVIVADPPPPPAQGILVGVDYRQWCLGRLKGDIVSVSPPTGDKVQNIKCCDFGDRADIVLEYRPISQVVGCMKNLVTQRFPARLDGQPVLISIAVWPAEECPGP